MKIHILTPLTDRPTGGGNQFLAALRNELGSLGAYADTAADADIIIFNSFPFGMANELYRKAVRLKQKKGDRVKFIHRVDGPISVVRGNVRDISTDASIGLFNSSIADATVYQSDWSRNVCQTFGLGLDQPSTTISNAPNSAIFHPREGPKTEEHRKTRLISSSWSSNWKKGFDGLRFLDRNLDFSRYELTFVGNSPVNFQNIRVMAPMKSHVLAEELRQHDLFFTASIDDPCSNALIEALHCGLPAVAARSGGNSEIVGPAGVLFDTNPEAINGIERCAASLPEYQSLISRPSMGDVAASYFAFAQKVYSKQGKARAPHHSQLRKLKASATVQRYKSGITKRVARAIPMVDEARFYPEASMLRTATWEPESNRDWSEQAHDWVKGVTTRLPIFLGAMSHPDVKGLFKYSFSGELHPTPALASSVFAAKLGYMIGQKDDLGALANHILSFACTNGEISDPYVEKSSRMRRRLIALKHRNPSLASNETTVRAETRQAFAALECLGKQPTHAYSKMPDGTHDIERYVKELNWSAPWGAGANISHLSFFLHRNQQWFGSHSPVTALELMEFVDTHYRRDDGSWYENGATVSLTHKINGAMKMITALEAAGLALNNGAEKLIDLCLSAVNDGHACDHFNVICVLHHCTSLTKHRRSEVELYCLRRLEMYRSHYWPWHGGFSFFADRANTRYYEARVSTGMAEPDIHGTVLMVWGIVLISRILEWDKALGLHQPIT